MNQAACAIRRINENEIDNVVNINRECLPENYSRFFFTQMYKAFPQYFLIAEDKGEIAGYIMARTELSPTFLKFIKKLHIISIAVLPKHRRRGIATGLMETVEERAVKQGVEKIFLEVRVTNYPAIQLYKKLGYKITNILKGYYRDGEDAYLMEKEINPEKNLDHAMDARQTEIKEPTNAYLV